ncbi:uncharacterized protein F5147DRAFT_746665 [Suillus discolor]|uniref:CxC1-like cysteine cluster associated with KDZ transposases domain-containing protein n=1 Tax=Suillus discolor TaxID=1912936 RepID=A0A9P7F364_9AGAM|nr:uncharacterized protein F5147DRAFT_746665 [Suillus discolor]KAG2103699.1 hypothetical protein F5147DRAFT_746665 [Suillus discolor]
MGSPTTEDHWHDKFDHEISHEGGEYSDAAACVLQFAAQSKYTSHKGPQARHERLRMMYAHWDLQISQLARAYLQWKHNDKYHNVDLSMEEGHIFHVTTVGTLEREAGVSIHQHPEEPANMALLRLGLLGCSPVEPSVAIEVHTLELYHRLRRRHAQLSIQAFTRALCDIHKVNCRTCFREQFSIAFDAYLSILQHIRSQVDDALGRSDMDWWLKHMCPCCTYEINGEEMLKPKILVACDGNNSCKRIAGAALSDHRNFDSSYFISHQEVNQFKNEVQHRQHINRDKEPDDKMLASCLAWKSSAPDHKKTAADIYETTGIFASACRHGFIIKLAKYPLAITNAMINAYGKDIGMGYDVGCTFSGIVRNSPLLSQKAEEARMQFCVNSFHGYAHNQLCQVQHHPLYLPGFGLEDLETMERVFLSSNSVSRVIRYASRYHWAQFIDLHFQQWDEDKYGELSKFLLNNYMQAIGIIKKYRNEVSSLASSLNIRKDDFKRWIEEEKHFLMDLKDELVEHVLACSYVQALMDLQSADQKWQKISDSFRTTSHAHAINYKQNVRQTSQLEAQCRAALDGLMIHIRAVVDLEERLGIKERWTPQHPEYLSALKRIKSHDFRRALDKLQQLVVQRLLELAKANLSGTGYKLRVHISKAIKARSKAIRNALDEYNKLAPSMQPPAPQLAWNDIVNYGFLSKFELLKHSHSQQDVLHKPWTVPGNREIAMMYFKMKRSHEELTRLNVEIHRLRTFICDEDIFLQDQVAFLHDADPLLAHEVEALRVRRARVDAIHIICLDTIEALPEFSGVRGTGTMTSDAGLDEDDGSPEDIATDDAFNDDMNAPASANPETLPLSGRDFQTVRVRAFESERLINLYLWLSSK